MRHLLFIIIALGIAVGDASAQRYLPGMRGLQLVAGIALRDGFHSGIAFSQYTKGADRWIFGLEYLEKRHRYKDTKIPQSQFAAEGGYYLKFLSDRSKALFLSLGASAMAGYETLNWGDRLLFDGATLDNADKFLYGEPSPWKRKSIYQTDLPSSPMPVRGY
jgi:hypothetical protein